MTVQPVCSRASSRRSALPRSTSISITASRRLTPGKKISAAPGEGAADIVLALARACFARSRAVASVGDVFPDLALREVHQAGEDDQEDHHLEAHALALDQVRLGGP